VGLVKNVLRWVTGKRLGRVGTSDKASAWRVRVQTERVHSKSADHIRYEVSEMLGWSGLWAADSARSPLRSRFALRSRSIVFFHACSTLRSAPPYFRPAPLTLRSHALYTRSELIQHYGTWIKMITVFIDMQYDLQQFNVGLVQKLTCRNQISLTLGHGNYTPKLRVRAAASLRLVSPGAVSHGFTPVADLLPYQITQNPY